MSVTTLFDPVAAQEDLTYLLLSDERLRSVQVKSYRKMRLTQELDYRTMLVTPRNGRAGAAIIVAQPVANNKNTNVSGPVFDWLFPVVCLEEPNINLNAVLGTLIEAEQLGQIVANALHLHADEKYGNFRMVGTLEPEKEWVFPGVIGYRATFSVVGKSIQTPRVSALQVAVDGNAVTSMTSAAGSVAVTSATAGATIRYTLDGTYPAADEAGNPTARTYSGPVAASPGDVLRVAGYKEGLIQSAVRQITMT